MAIAHIVQKLSIMQSKILREKFIKFFQSKGHKLLPASSLIPTDPSVLLTTAGMQQFKDWFSGEVKPKYGKVVTVQPCFRTSDIEEVGDNSHLTFFEMMGNFSFGYAHLVPSLGARQDKSFGSYFKKEAIDLTYEFLTKDLKINAQRITVTIFPGDKNKNLPLDSESFTSARQIFDDKQILMGSSEDNFWGPTGDEGPCGPTLEIFVDGIEVWNLVFNQYYCDKNRRLKPLALKGVDTGMGLERLAAVMQGEKSVFQTDIYSPILAKIDNLLIESKNVDLPRSALILADHIRGITFLSAEGILPANKQQGYVLRRLIRRAILHGFLLKLKKDFLKELAQVVIAQLGEFYPNLVKNKEQIISVLAGEEDRFLKTLQRGLTEFEKIKNKSQKDKIISGAAAFKLADTFGFPIELTEELAQKDNFKVAREDFAKAMEMQREVARKSQKVSSGSANPKLHTACHLLHQALREVLGPHAKQAGQDVTGEVLRFDFTHPQELTDEQLRKIEQIVNQKIKDKLTVTSKLTTVSQAKKEGAIALFEQKYADKVTLYDIGGYSKELCAGPHVKNTGELGHFKILSEKSAASGVRRIKARLH